MDPAATLLAALNSMNDVGHCGDDQEMVALSKEDAAEHLRNLADWLDKGGFTPDAEEVARDFLERLGD